jgi:hypothetical protein
MPSILPSLVLTQISIFSARPMPGSAIRLTIAAAVAPTSQRRANFKEAGMLTPSIFFCPTALLHSDRNFIALLLLASPDQNASDGPIAKSIDHLTSDKLVTTAAVVELKA